MTDYQALLLPRLAAYLGPDEIRRWFDPLRWLYDPASKRLALVCPTVFHQKKLAGDYATLLLDLALEAGRPLSGLSLDRAQPLDSPSIRLELESRAPASISPIQYFSPLNGTHSFERFLEGSSNRLAALALRNLAAEPASRESASLLLTAAGPWGKSHLLDALALSLSRAGRRGLIKISGDRFRADPPARLWAEAEVVIVDDIHHLESRPQLQQQLVQLFDEALARPLTLVFGSPLPPQRLTGLSEPLRSRLGGGLVLSIDMPEYELLLALAERKSAELSLGAPPEILAALVRAAKGDPRRLSGFLETLAFITRQAQLPLVKALGFLDLDDRRSDPSKSLQMDMETILRGVADAFGLKVADLTGHSRLRQAAWPRRVAMLLARELTSLTTTEIGEAFGGRDHSTVIHALKKARQELQNPTQIQMLENIKRSLALSQAAKPGHQ